MKKQAKWHKRRHTFFYHFSRVVFRIYAKTRLRYRGEKFDNRRPYLFLFNHQTPYDSYLLSLSLPKQTYTVASEDLFTMGIISKIIEFGQAPIPIKKSMSDVGAVMNCLRVAREGYSISIAPEGARSFTGETLPLRPAIAKLVKALKMPVAFFVVRGGYSVLPRYADKARRAKGMTGKITRVLEYEEYKDMSNEELLNVIEKELYVDESDCAVRIKNNHRAEFLERAVYRCPACGAIGTLKSKKNAVVCSSCKAAGKMDEYGRFQKEFPVHTVKEWVQAQEAYIRTLPFADEKPFFCEKVKLRKLVREKRKKEIIYKKAEARLYPDRLEVGGRVWRFPDMDAATACGRYRLDFYADGDTYQLTAEKTFCAIKYVNLFYHYQNGEENPDGFLGI